MKPWLANFSVICCEISNKVTNNIHWTRTAIEWNGIRKTTVYKAIYNMPITPLSDAQKSDIIRFKHHKESRGNNLLNKQRNNLVATLSRRACGINIKFYCASPRVRGEAITSQPGTHNYKYQNRPPFTLEIRIGRCDIQHWFISILNISIAICNVQKVLDPGGQCYLILIKMVFFSFFL